MNCFQPPDSDEDESIINIITPNVMHRDEPELIVKPSRKISDAEKRCRELEIENAKLKSAAAESRDEVLRWRSITKSFVNSLLLSPENCEYLKKTTTELMISSLKNVDHEVQFVDCSFPSAPTNAPDLQLVSRNDEENSQWELKWNPSWSVQVLCSATLAGVGYSILIRVSNFEIQGKVNFTLNKGASEITIQFTKTPSIAMELHSAVKVGPQIPMPLKTMIDRTVRGACDTWLQKNVVAPKSISIILDKMRRRTTLTDEDVKAAMLAAVEGERRSKT
mmetsp:Transcript_12912/g.15424  ORF Transcript_12912/g.15424 Transcript_12912/m.15424 type:complete len:278 (-) Transcript_12912:5-838(-)